MYFGSSSRRKLRTPFPSKRSSANSSSSSSRSLAKCLLHWLSTPSSTNPQAVPQCPVCSTPYKILSTLPLSSRLALQFHTLIQRRLDKLSVVTAVIGVGVGAWTVLTEYGVWCVRIWAGEEAARGLREGGGESGWPVGWYRCVSSSSFHDGSRQLTSFDSKNSQSTFNSFDTFVISNSFNRLSLTVPSSLSPPLNINSRFSPKPILHPIPSLSIPDVMHPPLVKNWLPQITKDRLRSSFRKAWREWWRWRVRRSLARSRRSRRRCRWCSWR